MKMVILTDKDGKNLGSMSASDAHQNGGVLHKAFSIFVFRNDRSELLLQKRQTGKRFGDLWTNTCCSHQRTDAGLTDEAADRLQEEMGFTVPLTEVGSFIYRADDHVSGEAEHELDYVLVAGVDDIEIAPHPEEVSEWKWMKMDDLWKDLKDHPERYTPWFHQALTIATR